MRISDWSSDVCSSDLLRAAFFLARVFAAQSAPENSSEIPMQFSQLLSAMRGADGEWQVDVPADWQQGRTLFGGLQAALAVRAMRGLVPASTPLRTLQATFISPVPGGPLRFVARVLRSGNSAPPVEAELYDVGQIGWRARGIL